MKGISRNVALLATTLFLLAANSCSGDNSTGPGVANSVTVTGIVVAIEDLVPVDGGVTIDIQCLNGRTERFLFPSLFTNPPPSEDTQQLYRVIMLLERGNLVRAGGTRTGSGIDLERLTILCK